MGVGEGVMRGGIVDAWVLGGAREGDLQPWS